MRHEGRERLAHDAALMRPTRVGYAPYGLSQELNEGLAALRLLNRLGREAVFTFEIMTTPAVFRIVAGQVFDVILGSVRHLLLMNANCAMAMHATYVISV